MCRLPRSAPISLQVHIFIGECAFRAKTYVDSCRLSQSRNSRKPKSIQVDGKQTNWNSNLNITDRVARDNARRCSAFAEKRIRNEVRQPMSTELQAQEFDVFAFPNVFVAAVSFSRNGGPRSEKRFVMTPTPSSLGKIKYLPHEIVFVLSTRTCDHKSGD